MELLSGDGEVWGEKKIISNKRNGTACSIPFGMEVKCAVAVYHLY